MIKLVIMDKCFLFSRKLIKVVIFSSAIYLFDNNVFVPIVPKQCCIYLNILQSSISISSPSNPLLRRKSTNKSRLKILD
ncbi:hypothetical protein BpHYR1_008348 [Brachionus plicatilis]|uniref:Uncharacterized protein n=1 Tax=Brachionus plicatilis TaxID=10195 RepID=A0A3M7SCL2_BRAPC|nr:hypothetical protein BpHYR1_008348 [Brachionus plicatilis]